MSEHSEGSIYNFAGFSIDVTRRQLLNMAKPVPLTSKAFDTLLILVKQRGTTVTKSDLMNSVWADTAVEENNLTQQISALRKVLGERPGDHRFIVTVPGRGYCFVADAQVGPVEDNVITLERPRKTVDRLFAPWLEIDPGAMRGYVLAIVFISIVSLSPAWSAYRNYRSGRPQSLAVLSFKIADRTDEFIGNGIGDTLRARLGSVEDLTVRPGDLALSDQDALAAGRRLQVDTVVTGSVQRDHDRIRVAVEMLDVAGGRIIWGRTFDDSASNLFALQDSIAGEVARVLNVDLVSRRGAGTLALDAIGEKLRSTLTEFVLRRPEILSV